MTLRGSQPAARTRPHGHRNDFHAVRLLEAEPELGAGLDAGALATARHRIVAPGLRVPGGRWTPARGLGRALAVIVLDGLVLRDTTAFARSSVQLFGNGDLFDARALADGTSSWTALEPAHLAIVDGRFVLAAQQWPQLISGLIGRLFACEREQEVLAAITRMPRVEDRILALLSRLVLRWGAVTPTGLVVSLPVTHRVLGQMVGAQRPTVSLALTALTQQGLLDRLDDGRWVLPPESMEWSASGLPERRLVQPVRAGC